jgi:membrane-associated phospholipid phosphatase
LDGFFVSTALKYATGRERPTVDAFHGKFGQAGDSFPSDHVTTVWATASVLSHEYPGPFTKMFAYDAATAITFARVRGEKHFPADAFVGRNRLIKIRESVTAVLTSAIASRGCENG